MKFIYMFLIVLLAVFVIKSGDTIYLDGYYTFAKNDTTRTVWVPFKVKQPCFIKTLDSNGNVKIRLLNSTVE